MGERPIIFDAESVNAILAGRKTQTRRVMNPQPEQFADAPHWRWRHKTGLIACESGDRPSIYGKYVPGDRLWVRETWCLAPREDWEQWPSLAGMSRRFWEGTMRRPHTRSIWNGAHNAIYRADGEYRASDGTTCWSSPIHMPRWASRITIEVVAVRVERLHDITEADAVAEGCTTATYRDGRGIESAKLDYERRWDRINCKRAPWASNCWVWVVEFRRAEGGDR